VTGVTFRPCKETPRRECLPAAVTSMKAKRIYIWLPACPCATRTAGDAPRYPPPPANVKPDRLLTMASGLR
jgi:hypothetical protein